MSTVTIYPFLNKFNVLEKYGMLFKQKNKKEELENCITCMHILRGRMMYELNRMLNNKPNSNVYFFNLSTFEELIRMCGNKIFKLETDSNEPQKGNSILNGGNQDADEDYQEILNKYNPKGVSARVNELNKVLLNSKVPQLVVFRADWCHACNHFKDTIWPKLNEHFKGKNIILRDVECGE